ncbi:MAG: sulfurase [Acidobacteria bacterium]|nr:MAG: sulfurase [Acidobacteriota bacterium]
MTFKSAVVGIYIASAAEGEMTPVAKVRAVAGQGLEGDRYFLKTGTYSKDPGTGRHVTLIEVEAFEALKRDYGIELEPARGRRNIATRGVPLNHLVGREFEVGGTRLRGMRLCEPCSHLESLTRDGVKNGLVHRGGLRADVLAEGTIRVGDDIHLI